MAKEGESIIDQHNEEQRQIEIEYELRRLRYLRQRLLFLDTVKRLYNAWAAEQADVPILIERKPDNG